jgi:hypothetical protein
MVLGIPTGVVVVLVVLFFVNPFKLAAPCLVFNPIPSSSGVPAFPPLNDTLAQIDQSWCAPGATLVMHFHPYLQIFVNGAVVTLPGSIGRKGNYTQGLECDLPMHTHPPSAGYPDGIIHVESAWPYIYTLSDFFQVWAESYSTVFVNTSAASQPITYTNTDLLGFQADATHAVTLTVDGSPSAAGPYLQLNTLDYEPSPYPTCMDSAYGTGHTIVLSYSKKAPGTAVPVGSHGGVVTPGSTAPGGPPSTPSVPVGGALFSPDHSDLSVWKVVAHAFLVMRPPG